MTRRAAQTMLARTAAFCRPTSLLTASIDAQMPMLSLPFDAMRRHYAGAVMAGLVPRSLLDSARLERWLDALERLTLGPLARSR